MHNILSNAMKVLENITSAIAARIAYCEAAKGEDEKADRFFKEIKLLLNTENQLITVVDGTITSGTNEELSAALDAIHDDEEIADLLS